MSLMSQVRIFKRVSQTHMLADLYDKRREFKNQLYDVERNMFNLSWINPRYWYLKKCEKNLLREIDAINRQIR